jgi:hypothetical protein
MQNETIKDIEQQEIQNESQQSLPEAQENELDVLLRLIRTCDASFQQRNQIFSALSRYILSR